MPWLFALLVACKQEQHAEETHHAEKQRENEVQLTAEAIERAGIRVAVVERRALTGGAAIPAEVQFDPSSTAHVGPLVPGRITKVSVALGDRVRRAQLLGVVASSDVSAARARLDQARARLSAAEATLRRQQQLSTEGIGAQRALIEAEAQVGELRAEMEGQRRQLSVFGSGSAGELALTAPIDGVVVAVHATLGETATPDQPAFIVTDPSKVWVRGNAPELELARVQLGSAAIVRLHAFPELAMPGTITYVAPALDEATRSLPLRVTLDAPDARLRSGLFGSVELIGGSAGERVLVVPVDAVATLDGQSVVFVPAQQPNAFRSVAVALGRRAGGFFEVRSGLAEGAQLAVSGAFVLKSALRSSELSGGDAH
ncbi:MAG: efflux RND transporter periplasmic adaptor subunit [Polyangiaceae bacterium]